jgi:hypothetical protein
MLYLREIDDGEREALAVPRSCSTRLNHPAAALPAAPSKAESA